MKLGYTDMLLLATYLEFFNRCYDGADERKYDTGCDEPKKDMMVRHVEMQNIIYVLSCLHVPVGEEYSFSWNRFGPHSGNLQKTLEGLDEKEALIEEFYSEYNRERNKYYGSYKDQLRLLLSSLLPECLIDIVGDASFLLEDVLREEQGSEILGGIVYLGTTVIPGNGLPAILSELNARGYYPNPELAENIWRCLAVLGIRNKDTKELTRDRKLVSKHNGYIL